MIEHDIAHPALNDTDVFVVDFNDCPDMSFARVNSLNITYTKGNKDQMEALLKVQNIRTVFSAELLSIAGTIISDIFPNGLRKSSQIARKKFAAASIERHGYPVTYLSPDSEGTVVPEQLVRKSPMS